MATLTDIRDRARKFDAEVVINSTRHGELDIEVIAPFGRVWDGELHSLVAAEWDGNEIPRSEIYQDLLDRMTGTRECRCDLCRGGTHEDS